MSKEYVEVMIDTETTGVKVGAGIWQIGAIAVRECGNKEREIELTINPRSLISQGFTWDGATEVWQRTSNKENWHIAHTYSVDPESPRRMLLEFFDWVEFIKGLAKMRGVEVRYWCKGTDFDFPIIERAAEILGISLDLIPWKYNQRNDLRTLCNVLDRPVPRFVNAHNALTDADNQMTHLLGILRTLKGI